MSLPPTPSGVVRTRFLFPLGGGNPCGFRVFWAYTGGPPTSANLNTLAAAIEGAYSAHLNSLAATDVSLEQIICDDLASSSGASGQWLGSLTGTRAGNIPTEATCVVLELLIARRYRGGKPKSFLPFGVVGDLFDPRTWSGTFLNAVNSGWAAFQTAVEAISTAGITITNQVNVSYYHGHVSNPNPSPWSKKNVPAVRSSPVLDTIQGVAARPIIGNQKRRRGG